MATRMMSRGRGMWCKLLVGAIAKLASARYVGTLGNCVDLRPEAGAGPGRPKREGLCVVRRE